MLTPTSGSADASHNAPTYADLLARAYADAETRLGHPLTTTEAEAIGKVLTGRLFEAIIEETFDPEDLYADDALDPVTFTERHSKVTPLWGETDGRGARPFAARGEALVIFGGDGSFKSTLAQGLALRLAGVWEDPVLLGLEVHPVEGRVLYLALDRPAQIARSLGRFTSRLDARGRALAAERIVIRPHSLPEHAGRSGDGLGEWVEEYAARNHLGPIGAVVIDNISDVWGDLADTERATAAGQAVNRLAATGVEVVALHHPRKREAKDARRPESLDDVYGGRMFTKATGAVLGLHRASADDGAALTITHLKGPLGFRRPLTVLTDLTTGDLKALDLAVVTSEAPEADDDAAKVYSALKALGEATIPRLIEAVGWDRTRSLDEKVRRYLQGCSSVGEVRREGKTVVWGWLR